MQLHYTAATALDALDMPAPAAGASARGRFRQIWTWSMGWIVRYRARHQLPARDAHMARDIGQTRADMPHWIEPQSAARMSGGAFGWNAGAAVRISRLDIR
jgi:hypothetical protein